MAELNGVIFDMDGLIFDTELLYYQATQIVADQMAIPYTKDVYLAYVGVSDEEVWAAYHERYDAAFGPETVDRFIQAAFDQTLLLFEQGRVIDTLLDSAGLTQEFPEIVCFDDVVRAKPDPEIFEKAHNRLGVPKNQLVILEDSANGIHAAHAAGIPVIMVPDLVAPTSVIEEKVLHILPSLVEVPDYFEQAYTW